MNYSEIKFPRLISYISNDELREVKTASKKLHISVSDFVKLCVFEKVGMLSEDSHE